MSEPEFLEHDAVQFLHDQALREYGGLHGVRDEGLLQRALARTVNKLAYAGERPPDLFDLAAVYAFGIAGNYPFLDANKRTAWGSCVLFLKTNGAELQVPAPEVVEHMVRLALGDLGEDGFADWLRRMP